MWEGMWESCFGHIVGLEKGLDFFLCNPIRFSFNTILRAHEPTLRVLMPLYFLVHSIRFWLGLEHYDSSNVRIIFLPFSDNVSKIINLPWIEYLKK